MSVRDFSAKNIIIIGHNVISMSESQTSRPCKEPNQSVQKVQKSDNIVFGQNDFHTSYFRL